MKPQLKDLVGSDLWLNKLIKDPDRDVFEAERGEKDKDLQHVRPGFTPKRRKKGRKHV